MDSFAIEAAEGFANVGYPLDAQALLLCELDGTTSKPSEPFISAKSPKPVS
jgi:glycolate oxidase